MKKTLTLLSVVAALAVFTFAPKNAEAIALCSALPPAGIAFPEIDINTGYGTFSNSQSNPDVTGSIAVLSGTVLNIHVDSYAEPSTYNSTSYPGGTDTFYLGPNGRIGEGRDYTSSAITGSSVIRVNVGPNNCTPITDGETGSVTVNVTVIPPLSVENCSGTPNPATTGSPVTWSVPVPTGGIGSYTYSWSGTDSLGGSTRTVNKTYSGTGTKYATVTVTSGAQTVQKNCNVLVNPPSAPTVDLTGPASVASGQTATLTWTSQNTTSCTATQGPGFSTSGATSGSDASSALTANTTFSISCTGPGGTATDSVTVAVTALTCSGPTTLAPSTNGSFSASGGNGTYAWSTSPAGTPSTGSGSPFTTQWSTTGSKTVTVTSNGLTATCPVTVSVSNVSCIGPTAGQTGTSYTFTGSGGTTYTWAVSPTTGFLPSGSSGTGSSVSKTWSATGSKTITFTSGGQSGSCPITISSSPPSLSVDLRINGASSATVPYGQPATLTWSSNGATVGCRGSSNPDDAAWPDQSSWVRATSGTQQVLTSAPYVSRTYTIQCTNGASIVTDTVTATVVSSLACSPAVQSAYLNTNATVNASGGVGSYAWSGGETPPTGSNPSFTTQYSTTGAKTVTVVSGSENASCTINVIAPPVALTCSPATQNITAGGTANFTGSGGSGGPYNWSAPGGLPATGFGTVFSSLFGSAGTYYVTVSPSGTSN